MKETILPNGLKIITKNDPNSNVCTLAYSIKSGSYNELEHERGIAHLVEHMLFKGTINRDYTQINAEIEGIGGYLNAFTSFENTQYYCTVPYDCWQQGLDILSDLIFNNTIPEEELKKEKLVVQEEIKMYSDDLSSFIIEKLFNDMFSNYPNRKSIAGTVESVGKITRDNIIDFINRNYFPSNITVVATGNVNHDKIVSFLEGYIDKLNIEFTEYSIEKESFIPEKFNCKKNLYQKSEIGQTHLAFGMFTCPANDIDMVSIEILNNILGGSSTSILFNTIREKMGLAYTISTSIEEISDCSVLFGYAGLNSSNDLDSVIDTITNCILTIKDNITEDILERTKKYLIGMLYLKLENSSGKNLFISNKELFNDNYNYEDTIVAINNVTINTLRNVIDRYITKENLMFSILTNK